jgi:Cu+-exporting ATPase
MSFKSILLVAVLGGFAVACGGETPPAAAPSAETTPKAAPSAKTMTENGAAKVGDTTHCPVSGEEFKVTDASPKVEFEGKTYFTCCPGCAQKLKADPAKYLKKPSAS